MKKIVRAAVVFTALALLGTGFISCSDGDDSSSDNSGSQNPATPEKPGDSTPSEYDDSALLRRLYGLLVTRLFVIM
ncbi:MAG: hypothetical protein PUD00_02745 [Treponema berlinense]|uniref:hypothetical protein n=1 Tax=Treponema berlinense TaxID=225004 RepID=UPI0023F24F62|nr:hypothetical protein [Treponema berlinense]MDD5834137.1 hypothetical protein [Treponema berlinense]